jgi:hypothetical protein
VKFPEEKLHAGNFGGDIQEIGNGTLFPKLAYVKIGNPTNFKRK